MKVAGAEVTVDIPELTDVEFSAIRRRGIGGSDVAAILGLDPWRGPHDVWLAKMGRDEYVESEAAKWGKLLEPLVLQEYAERERVTLTQLAPAADAAYVITNPARPRFLQHKAEPWIRATVDAVVQGAHVGVDAKTKLDPYWSRDEWGDSGTDAVPKPILCQCTWYMGVTRFERWDVPVLWGNEMRVYRVAWNPRLFETLVARCRAFWETYVIGRVSPPLDDPRISRKVVEKVYPRNLSDLREATETEQRLIALYRVADDRLGTVKAIREKIEAAICAKIATADGLRGEFGKILWKRSRDTHMTDWEQVAWRLANRLNLDPAEFLRIRQEHTATRKGTRTFRHYWKEEEQNGDGGTEIRPPAIAGHRDRRAIAAGGA